MKNKRVRNLVIMASLIKLLSTEAIGEVESIESTAKNVYFILDKNGNVKEVYDTKIVDFLGKTYVDDDNILIFDDDNANSFQYGGSQIDFYEYYNLLIKDPYIWKEMQKCFPIESFSSHTEAMDFYELYLKKLGKHGCGYVAITDRVFHAFEGKEKEFEEIFGVPMYKISEDKSIDFNYELFTIKFFNYSILYPNYNEERKELIKKMFTKSLARRELDRFIISNDYDNIDRKAWKTLHGDEQLEFIYKIQRLDEEYYTLLEKWEKANNLDVAISLSDDNLGHIKEFLESYGIEADIDVNYTYEDIEPGDIIGSSNSVLYKENKYGEKYVIKDDIKNHGVYVVSVENGKIIVSSWGEKYIYDGVDTENIVVISIDMNVKRKTKSR